MAKPQPSKATGYSREEREQNRNNSNEKATEFSDRARGGFSYEGDGSKQVEFFDKNSNYNELIEKMSYRERQAFNDKWVPGEFMRGQQYGGFENMSRSDQEATRIYDKILDQSVINKGFVTYRLSTAELVLGAGAKTGSLDDFKAMKGKVVISQGNMSTGVAREGLTIGARTSTSGSGYTKSVEYKIKIPGGMKGAGMWIGDSRINSHFGTRQREFMTNRDVRYKVGNTRYDATRDVFVVELTYAGRLPHNYTHY